MSDLYLNQLNNAAYLTACELGGDFSTEPLSLPGYYQKNASYSVRNNGSVDTGFILIISQHPKIRFSPNQTRPNILTKELSRINLPVLNLLTAVIAGLTRNPLII
jgi:hypothetical protein